MPHVKRWTYNGEVWPSVNGISGLLHSDALDNWLRSAKNRKQGKLAQKKGHDLAAYLENLRKGIAQIPDEFSGLCASQWVKWFDEQELEILNVEPHLVNTLDRYHGSPDVIACDIHGEAVLGDDKIKKRFADYKLLMNEHAYAMCDSIDMGKGKIIPVPWKVPIERIVFWSYDPDSGEMYASEHGFTPSVYNDFLTLRKVWDIKNTSDTYFIEHATLLPSQTRKNATTTTGSVKAHPVGLVSDSDSEESENSGC